MHKAYIHIPCLTIREETSYVIREELIIRNLTPEEYLKMDKNKEFYVPNKNFKQTRPVILVITYNGPQNEENIIDEFFERRLESIYHALLITGLIIPNPKLSVSYFVYDTSIEDIELERKKISDNSNKIIKTTLGPVEREWIMKGSPFSYPYEDIHDYVINIFNQIDQIQRNYFTEEIHELLDVLTFTTLPEYWSDGGNDYNYMNAFVKQITVLENILFPSRKTQDENYCKKAYDESLGRYGLVNFFAFNLGLIAADSWDKKNVHFSHYKEIYQLRSKIIHGEIGFNRNDELITKTARGRNLIGNVIKILLKIGQDRKYEYSLPVLLAKSYNDKKLFNLMREA
jgi:hypothetical protein